MATRLYVYRSSTFSPSPNAFTPSVQGSWGSDFSVVYPCGVDGAFSDDGSFLSRSVNTSSSAGTIVHALCYSPPMQSTHLWSLAVGVDFNFRISEASTSQNCFLMNVLGVVGNDGTLKWVTSNMKDNTEASTSLCARLNNAGYSASADYTNVPGDRVFFEVGWDKDGAVSGNITISYGKSGSTDLGTGTDCNVNNPWVDLSHTITFDPEGTTYDTVSNTNQLMMMGCGT